MLSILKPYLLKNDLVIVLTEKLKSKLVNEMNQSHFFCYAKIVSIDDISLSYEDNYYVYFMEKYHLPPLISSSFRNELNFIDPSVVYQSSKLKELQVYYNELFKDSIIHYPNPLLFYKKTVFTLGINERIPFLDKLQIKYQPIFFESNRQIVPILYSSKDQYEMIHFAMLWIENLINQGVQLNKIILSNVQNEDFIEIRKYLVDASIPYVFQSNDMVKDYQLYRDFIKNINESTYHDAIELLINRDCIAEEELVRSKILDLLSFYSEEMISLYPECFRYQIDNLRIQSIQRTNAITLVNDDYVEKFDDVHLLVLHYNEGMFPRTSIDDKYIRDIEFEELGMLTSTKQNLLSKENASLFLRTNDNVTLIHYHSNQSTLYSLPELLVSVNSIEITKDKPDTIFPTMEKYYQLYLGNQVEKKTYDASFKGINSSTIDKMLSKNVNLSQTSLSIFFECPFHYLLSSLLKLDQFETTFYLYYGNVIHKMIENFSKGIPSDYQKILSSYDKDFPLNEKYKFRLYRPILEEKFKDLESILPLISFQGDFLPESSEMSIQFRHPSDPRFLLIGKIDQVYLYEHKEKTFAIIVDYKTGNTSFDFEQITSLKQIQLLMYYYLYMNERGTFNHEIGGMYYQQVHLKRKKRSDEGYKLGDYAYDGITMESLISDRIVDNVKIKGVKLKADGTFSQTKRLFSKDQMVNLIHQLDEKIQSTIHKIKNGEFDISPYPVLPGTKKSSSCEYCPYKNICYLESSVKSEMSLEELEEGEDDEVYESAE